MPKHLKNTIKYCTVLPISLKIVQMYETGRNIIIGIYKLDDTVVS